MANTIRARVDLKGVRADLESVKLGLGRQITVALREQAGPLAQVSRHLTPRGPGPTSQRDNLPHMAETITADATAQSIRIVSSHPGAGVREYGGTITPRGATITFEPAAMAHKAGELQLDRIERDLTRRIETLTSAHNL